MFFEFIQNSFEKMKSKNDEKLMEEDFIKAQEGSMANTWDDEKLFHPKSQDRFHFFLIPSPLCYFW